MADIVTQIIAGTLGTIVPSIVLTVSTTREAGNIVHPILGNANPDITLRPGTLRAGTIELGFTGPTADADSLKALNIHAAGTVLTLIHAERETVSMTYIASGRIERELDDTTRDAWIVRADFQEVRPR